MVERESKGGVRISTDNAALVEDVVVRLKRVRYFQVLDTVTLHGCPQKNMPVDQANASSGHNMIGVD